MCLREDGMGHWDNGQPIVSLGRPLENKTHKDPQELTLTHTHTHTHTHTPPYTSSQVFINNSSTLCSTLTSVFFSQHYELGGRMWLAHTL